MYTKYTWRFYNSTEYEYKYLGRYGAKGEKRQKRIKATPEQMAKQNQINKVNRIRRLMKANFLPGDLWTTLKYPAGTRKPLKEVKDDMSRFLRKLRYQYKKQGDILKYIYRIEIGKHGGLHIHILLNRTKGKRGADDFVAFCWECGYVHYTPIYAQGGYAQLAEYIAKPVPEEQTEHPEAAETMHYSTSRNLIRPEPEKKTYSRRTVRRILEDGPQATPEFYIDQDSIVSGTNKYTGMSYLRYTECRIKEVRRE